MWSRRSARTGRPIPSGCSSSGYFYGRGSSDDKFGAAVLVATLIRYKQEGYKPARDIIVALETEKPNCNLGVTGGFFRSLARRMIPARA
jgi:arginine utilization protein RocB